MHWKEWNPIKTKKVQCPKPVLVYAHKKNPHISLETIQIACNENSLNYKN